MDLCFLDGHPYPRCSVHIDRTFPDFYAVQLMSAGSFYFGRGDRARMSFSTPVFFWTDRTTRYRYGPGPTGSWEHHWISFRGGVADDYYQGLLEAMAPDGFVALSMAAEVERAFGELTHLIHVPADISACIHRLNTMLAFVHNERLEREPVDSELMRIQEAIDAHPEQTFHFQSLAARHGYAYSTFRRQFTDLTGVPPKRYVLTRRLQKAAQRLLRSSQSVQEIAWFYGYEDPARFSKAFKQHFGMSPAIYRRSVTGTYEHQE